MERRSAERAREGREGRFDRREVTSADPSLSPDSNQRLTEELRAAVGDDEVAVPAQTPRPSRERHARHMPLGAAAVSNGVLVGITFAALLTAGVAASMATGSWWALVIACGVHATGTIAVLVLAMSLASKPEHVSPQTAAQLEDEGVAEPDDMFSDMVAEYRGQARPAGERRRLTAGEEEPGAAWRGYLALGAGAVTLAMLSMIAVGLALGWL